MEYIITNVQRRDEWRSKYARGDGNDMVDYAIALRGEDGWVKLTQRITSPPPAVNSSLTGEIRTEQTRTGTSYKKFKKVDPAFQGGGQQSAPIDTSKLDYIVQMLEELTGRRSVPDRVAPMSEESNLSDDDPFVGMGV